MHTPVESSLFCTVPVIRMNTERCFRQRFHFCFSPHSAKAMVREKRVPVVQGDRRSCGEVCRILSRQKAAAHPKALLSTFLQGDTSLHIALVRNLGKQYAFQRATCGKTRPNIAKSHTASCPFVKVRSNRHVCSSEQIRWVLISHEIARIAKSKRLDSNDQHIRRIGGVGTDIEREVTVKA